MTRTIQKDMASNYFYEMVLFTCVFCLCVLDPRARKIFWTWTSFIKVFSSSMSLAVATYKVNKTKPNLLLNRNVKSNSDPLLPRVPNNCQKWYFVETVRYCSCVGLVYLWQGLRQPIVVDVVEVCLSDVDTVCYGVVQSWAQEVATGASMYKRPDLHPQGNSVPFPLLKIWVN